MIEEQFVSFETAKLLKEAGFEVPCRGIYRTDRTGDYVFREYERNNTKDDLCWNSADGFQYEYLAPTQALAARWLREEHGIDVLVDIDTIILPTKRRKYNAKIFIDKSIYCISGGHNSYENAIEKGIQEAIKLIKKQGL